MLYVFIVSTGTTLNFDMNLAVKKVLELKTEIYHWVHIPVEDQVLLCSGGEELKSENIVGNYSGAGTDTNPIFLFSKSNFKLPVNENITSIDTCRIINEVKDCSTMIPSLNSITIKASLAQQFAELALKGKKECSELVNQQHLQQQGWLSVIANLEDHKNSLKKQKEYFDDLFKIFSENSSSYRKTIQMFPDDISLLARVPLLSKLLIESECTEEDLERKHTLLSWFCSEPWQVLESLVENCQAALDQLNENSISCLNREFEEVIQKANNPEYKELRGIGDRLSKLNKQIDRVDDLSKSQNEIILVFNSDQINCAKDPNVLPDLCSFYQEKLEIMLKNYTDLGEILQKCKIAKMELSNLINFRIEGICEVEIQMYNIQMRIMYNEKLAKSVTNQIKSFHQVHLAPQRYLKMLAEVCRRREFSTNFMKWATELSEKASKLYHKEISLRKSFSNEESKNMVDNLFPGMDDVLPKFAVECPAPFDQNLPSITKEDLDGLKTLFPEFSHLCEVLPPDPMPYFFQAESDSAFSSNIPSSLKISSLDTSHSNIMKVHAKISALQKLIQELQCSLKSDLSNLREYVTNEMAEKMTDASEVTERIHSYVETMHKEMLLEKERAVSEAKKEIVSIENAYRHRLEVESQKLNDAENQIARYEEHLRETSSNLEEKKHENEQLVSDLKDIKELFKRMMLEHELELDSFKIQMKEENQNKDTTITELQQSLSEALSEVTKLKQEKADMQIHHNRNLETKQATLYEMQEEQKSLKEEILLLQESKGVSKDFSEIEMKLQLTLNEKAQCLQEWEEMQQNLIKFQADAEKSKDSALRELQEQLASKHKNDLESLRSRFKMAVSTTSFERSPSSLEQTDVESFIGLEDLRKEMAEIREKLEEEKKRAIEYIHKEMQDNLNKEILKREEEKNKTIAILQSEHEEALERLKSRITAESQVSFNEAINRLSKEKESVIEDLRSRLAVLEAKQLAIKSHLEKYISSRCIAAGRDSMSQSDSSCSCGNMELYQAEEGIFLLKLRGEVEPFMQQESSVSSNLYQCSQSSSSIVVHESCKKRHKTKEDYQQVATEYFQPRPYSCLDCKNKISILTCSNGDLVLVCYEERHQNYAIYHFGPYAHFLHSDSLQAMNLKLPEKPVKSSDVFHHRWALGVVICKEFCVTKKKENRYKVLQGTKFYRVKVKPWDRETALALHQMQQSTQMTTTICGPKPPDFQSPSDDGDGSSGRSSDMSQSAI